MPQLHKHFNVVGNHFDSLITQCNEKTNRIVNRKKCTCMRNIFFLALLFSLCSCKKDNGVKTLKRDIVGTWELEKVVGYPFNQPPFPPGNGRIVVLGEDGSFERKQHDTLVFRGNYTVRTKKDCYERNTDIILSTDENSYGDYQYIETSDGKLSLSTPNCYQDGGTAYYRRLK